MKLNIKNLLVLVVATELAGLLLLAFLVIRLEYFEQQLNIAADDRFRLVAQADELRQSSDDLTRFARTFVATGEEGYRKDYLATLSIRNGETPRPRDYGAIYWDLTEPVRSQRHPAGDTVSLTAIMGQLPYSTAEREKLVLAEANSNDLVNLEVEAFNAMDGKFKDNEGDYTVIRKPAQAYAIKLLHSPAYHQAKHKIMLPIDEFISMLDTRTRGNVMVANEQVDAYLSFQRIVTLLFISFNLYVFFLLRKRVLIPVQGITESIAKHRNDDQPLTFSHDIKDEIGTMVAQFDAMNKDLMHTREAAEQSNRAKSAFLANMSHELRTPLNAILGYSEMLQEEAEDFGHDDYIPDLKKIHKAGKHLLSLINDILDLSKIEAGRMDLYLERFDLNELLKDVTGTIAPLLQKDANKLELDVTDGLGIMRADVTKVRQVLFNLLSNAAKFTHEGKIVLGARREQQAGRDWIRVWVADEGIGIAVDKIKHLFEEFTQADESTTRNYGGTGLGLAISRRFCEMMGGELTVESTLGEGSTFTLQLPAEVDALEAARASKQSRQEGDGPAQSAVASDAVSILVVDDDPTVCDMLQRTLEKNGYRVTVAMTAVDGLRLAREIKPDAITMDVMMPGKDGWTLLKELKADATVMHIPVVMLTMVDNRTMGYSLGAAHYMTKPINREGLLTVLEQHTRRELSGPVLVVDDDAEARSLLCRLLEKEGCTVKEASNGREALEVAKQQVPSIILLDLMMPEMNGFEFVREFRKEEAWSGVPIIVLTAMTMEEKEFAELRRHVEHVICKGEMSGRHLLEHIQSAIGDSKNGQRKRLTPLKERSE